MSSPRQNHLSRFFVLHFRFVSILSFLKIDFKNESIEIKRINKIDCLKRALSNVKIDIPYFRKFQNENIVLTRLQITKNTISACSLNKHFWPVSSLVIYSLLSLYIFAPFTRLLKYSFHIVQFVKIGRYHLIHENLSGIWVILSGSGPLLASRKDTQAGHYSEPLQDTLN